MTYNKKKFITDSLSQIAQLLVVTGLCWLFGWSSLFLFFGLIAATQAAKLPLKFIIRGLFSKEKAIVLETALDLIQGIVLAQQLFVASCIKLFILTSVYTVAEGIGTLGVLFSKSFRDQHIKKIYPDEVIVPASESDSARYHRLRGDSASMVNEPLSMVNAPSAFASNSGVAVADQNPPPYDANSLPGAQANPEVSMRRTAARKS